MPVAEQTAIAFRLFVVGAAVWLVPGLAFVARLKIEARFSERLVLAFVAGGAWLMFLSMLLPAVGASIDIALALTTALSIGLLWNRATWRTLLRLPALRFEALSCVLVVAVVAFAMSAWVREPPVTGEEALDLASMSHFADGGAITFDNTSLMPATRAVYLFQPYQLGLGMLARYSGIEPIVALIKIRPLFVLLSLTFVYALLLQLAPTISYARAAFAVVLTFVALDVVAWEWNSLFPFVRRGSIGAGLWGPALMVIVLLASRRGQQPGDVRLRRICAGLVPLGVLAALCTHALEVATGLWFVAALVAATRAGLDPGRDSRPLWKVGVACFLVAAMYIALQSRMVPEVAARERSSKAAVWDAFASRSLTPASIVIGPIPEQGEDLIGDTIPEAVTGIAGVPVLLLAAFAAPAAAAILALGIVPLSLMYASPGGVVLLSLLMSPDTVKDVGAYFGLLGLIGLSLGAVAAAQALVGAAQRARSLVLRVGWLAAGLLVVAAAWRWLPGLTDLLLEGVEAHPAQAVLVGALCAATVLAIAFRRRHITSGEMQMPLAVALVAVALAVPFLTGERASHERLTLLDALRSARATPSVLAWMSYYSVLQESIRPPLSVPESVLADIKRSMPSRQILLANPRDSCALVVLLDAYCINPERIYGHFFLSARRYHEECVHDVEGHEEDWHPFFNSTWPAENCERTLLRDYRVGYLLADPEHQTLIERKLLALNTDATTVMRRDGYVLYRIGQVR